MNWPTDRRVDDLYVLQNEYGLIKIGRSFEPERRCRIVASRDRCKAQIVEVLVGKGFREPAIHRRLERFALGGEWFDGDSAARSAVQRAINPSLKWAWPYELDEDQADQWLQILDQQQFKRYVELEFSKVVGNIRFCNWDNCYKDEAINELYNLTVTGDFDQYDIRTECNETVIYIAARPPLPERRVPSYCTDLKACLALWPAGTRPALWTGTPIECAIAALKQRLTDLRAANYDYHSLCHYPEHLDVSQGSQSAAGRDR